MSADDLEFIRKFPEECCTEVTRGGRSYPCGEAAVAVVFDFAEDGHWWPVCAHHTRKGFMVPLTELIKALTT